MVATDVLERTSGPPAAMPLQRQWPQLGKELFTLERALTEQEPLGRREVIRGRVLAELYRNEGKHPRDARYRAFLVVEKGKAGEIVGNPYYVDVQFMICNRRHSCYVSKDRT